MKRIVSISIGSRERDHKAQLDWMGQHIQIERIGTDGDIQKAAQLYAELDDQVDAFGVGGTDLGLRVADRYYAFPQMQRMVAGVKHTPIVDGGGLKHTLERQVMQFVERELGDQIEPKTCFATSAVDRYGMGESQFVYEVGYRNLAQADLVFVEFLWRAHDAKGKLLFERRSRHEEVLEPGIARRAHDVDVKPSEHVNWVSVEVSRARLADGTEWARPAAQ